MNIRLAATLVIAALIAPVAGHAADAEPVKESSRENVGDAVTTTRIRVEYAKDKPVKITRGTTGVSSVKNETKGQAKQ
jgi:hypothetical protein